MNSKWKPYPVKSLGILELFFGRVREVVNLQTSPGGEFRTMGNHPNWKGMVWDDPLNWKILQAFTTHDRCDICPNIIKPNWFLLQNWLENVFRALPNSPDPGQCNSQTCIGQCKNWNWPSTDHPPKWRRQKTSDESRLGMNTIPFTGKIPRCCHETLLQLQPKSKTARSATEFRPVPKIKLTYIIYIMFAYLVLDRIEQPLESALLHLQPICCKQHDYIEGRLLSAPRGFCPKVEIFRWDGFFLWILLWQVIEKSMWAICANWMYIATNCFDVLWLALLLPGSTEGKKPLGWTGCTTNM